MHGSARLVVLSALLGSVLAHDVHAGSKTVCTITVNSPDEKESFRRRLPQEGFELVELVERGRPDWLASACRSGIRCDVLLISGHFDDGFQFYSDRLEVSEFLAVSEMERASCSESCTGLFSRLQEVYLFGCNTLDAEAPRSASAEIERSLVRSGHSRADAERFARVLSERHADSNRDRMRRIFKGVPVIYGFAGAAPLGPVAATVLERYFQSSPGGEIGSGRPSPALLALFAPLSMTVAPGLGESDPQIGYRQDLCQFVDDRASAARKIGFVHRLLGREMAEVRMFLDQIERAASAWTDAERHDPTIAAALDAIADDQAARARFLDFARDADQPAVRARMIALAGRLGWLSLGEQREELARMFGELLRRNTVGPDAVALACTLNADGQLGQAALQQVRAPSGRADRVARAAVLACLGSAHARARVVQALTSPDEGEVEIAQTYLHHRPLADADELRRLAAGIARMNGSPAQVRALHALARHQLSDRESLGELLRLFIDARSVDVQRAIAGILIRADHRAIAGGELVRALRRHRLAPPEGNDAIDVLIRRLETSTHASASEYAE